MIKENLMVSLDKIPIMSPNHKLKLLINIIVIMINLFEFFYIPLTFSFQINPSELTFTHLLIYLFLLFDIMLSFTTGYYYRGTLIMTRNEIIQNYLKNDFFIDIITLLPVIVLETLAQNPFIKLFKYIFLFRILYLDKMLNKIWNFYSSSELVNYIISFFKLIVWIFFMAHIFACSMYKISYDDDKTIKLLGDANFYEYESFFTQYLCILEWALATMLTIGYGDETSKTKQEKIFNIFTMLIACCVFISIMNKIGEMIDEKKNRFTHLTDKINKVTNYLHQKTNDVNLKLRVRKYLEYVLAEKRRLAQEGQEIVSNLSNSLKMEIFQIINSEIINNMSILKRNFSWSFLCSLTTLMIEISYTPEDWIIDVIYFFNIYIT